MKRMKRIVSVLLAMVMVLGMSLTVFADETGASQAANDGSITINGNAGTGQAGTEVPVAGKTFKAYQILRAELANGTDATGGVIYRVPEALRQFYADYFSLSLSADGAPYAGFDEDVTTRIAALNAEELQDFSAEVLAAAKLAGNAVVNKSETAETDATSVTIDNLPLGYYVVEDEGAGKPISALALTTTVKDASVNIKASKPVIDKKIDGDEDTDPETEGQVEYNNASVGDVVPYVVTSYIPDMTGYKKYYFIVNDTLSKGLTFNDDIEIAIRLPEGDFVLPDDVDDMMLEEGWITLTPDNGDTLLPDDVDSMGTEGRKSDYSYKVTNNPDGTTGVEIVFKDFVKWRGEAQISSDENAPKVIYPNNLAGAEIVIKYSATVNQDAVIGVAGNPNEVKLTFSNNPNVDDDGDPENPDKPNPGNPNPPTGETPESVTRTYITGIELTKVDEKGNHLVGAEFQIEGTRLNAVLVSSTMFVEAEDGEYWLLKNNTYTKTAPVDDTPQVDGEGNPVTDEEGNQIMIPGTKDLYQSITQKYKRVVTDEVQTATEEVKVSATVDESGVLRFNGLAAGVYTITELKAPNGYNLLRNPITVKIQCTVPEEDATSTDCTWKAVYTFDELNEEQLTSMGEKTVEELQNDKAAILGSEVTLNELAFDSEMQLFPLEVENRSGLLLPSTGGIGTTIFYVAGSILVLAAVVLLVTKKRMTKEK